MNFTFKKLIFPVDIDVPAEEMDLEDYNSEVVVLIEEEDEAGNVVEMKYAAPFFTYRNIETVRKEHQVNGKFIHGKYFWVSGLTLIDKYCRESIEEVVKHLIDEGDFRSVFKSISIMN